MNNNWCIPISSGLKWGPLVPPCVQSLLLSSWSKRIKTDYAWIASNLWSGRSSIFWTSQSCFLSSNRFCKCKLLFINKPMVITEQTITSAHEAWARNYILATCRACSTKMLLVQSLSVLECAKIEQAKEKLRWQGNPVLPTTSNCHVWWSLGPTSESYLASHS